MAKIGAVRREDFEIRDNATFIAQFVVRNKQNQIEDVTGWNAKIQFRTNRGGALLATFGLGSGIGVDGPAGTFELKIQPATTQAWEFNSGWFDVIITNATLDKICQVEGSFVVVKGMTY